MAWFNSLTLICIFSTMLIFCEPQNFTISPFPLPQKTWSHASGIYNNTLTIINGGDNEFNAITDSFSLVLESSIANWKQNILTLPLGITGILIEGDNTVQVENKLYIINPNIRGNTALQWNILLVYDLSTHSYIQTETPLFLASFTCAVYDRNNNMIYIIGGISDDVSQIGMNETQTYNISNNSFAVGSEIIIARAYSGCAMDVKYENIFLFGGAQSRFDFLNFIFLDSIEKYSVSNNKWIVLNQTLNSGKANILCTTLAINNNIYCSSNGNDKRWEVFNVDTFGIETIFINIARQFFAVSVWQETCLFVSGGIFIEGNSDLKFLNSSETFGICPTQTINLTLNPTLNPTEQPTNDPTTNDISECFIGDRCNKTEDCCPININERENGITCRCSYVDIFSLKVDKNTMFCCIRRGYFGCLKTDDCCGEKSVCFNNKCVKDGNFLLHDDGEKLSTFDSLEDIDSNISMTVMFVVCSTCLIVPIIIIFCVCTDNDQSQE